MVAERTIHGTLVDLEQNAVGIERKVASSTEEKKVRFWAFPNPTRTVYRSW
jgi:hypothetical protein